MQKNTHSLPHTSRQNGYHLDVYTHVEGKQEPIKCHLPISEPPVSDPRSIEALRQRLRANKGY